MKIRRVELIQNASRLREAVLDGRSYLVAPVVLLVEGVHNLLMYTAAEIAESVDLWNALPFVLPHPKKDGEYVSARQPDIIEEFGAGILFNVFWDADAAKLRGEVYVDIEKANRIDPTFIPALRAGKAIEVSTGLLASDDGQKGEWNGESFLATLFDYAPDHLAGLPGEKGACSWEDGCGIRANKRTKQRQAAAKVAFTDIEEGPWPHGGQGFSDYRDAYYTQTNAKRPDDADLPQSPADAPKAMRAWIVSKTLLGDLDARTESELIRLPIVSSASDNLNLLALYAAMESDAATLAIDPQALEEAQKEAESLIKTHFGEERVKYGPASKAPTKTDGGDDGGGDGGDDPEPPGPSPHPRNPLPKENKMNRIERFLARIGIVAAEEMSDDDKRSKLDELIQEKPPQTDQAPYKWVVQVYSDEGYFVYSVNVDGKRTLYKQAYAMTDAGPALAGEATEVVEKKEYVPASAGPTVPAIAGELQPKEDIMSNKILVDALIACERTRFIENDREWLDKLTPCQLDQMKAADPPAPPPPPAPKTPEEFVANAPKEMKDTLLRALARDKAAEDAEKEQSTILVNEILKNARNKFTKEQLEGKNFDELQTLVALGGGEVSFAGAAPGPSVTAPVTAPDPNEAYKPAAK